MQLVILSLLLVSLTSAQTLRQAAAGKHFTVGSAANLGDLSADGEYKSVLAAQYNLITAENECKWDVMEPNRDQFNFGPCDAIYNFARASNQSFRGHNLCWGSQNPNWLLNGHFSANDKISILTNHITKVVQRYGSAPVCWDVVNEAVADSGPNLLKNNIWYPDIPDYVALAFKTARAANPNVKLFYNDYNIASATGWSAPKSQQVYDMIKSFKQRGIPIDGVGFQLHIDISYGMFDGIKQNMQRYADLGLEIHFTEIDVNCAAYQQTCGQWTPQKEQQQAQVYAQLMQLCRDQPKCTNFETWGYTDKYTWAGSENHPLPFDANFNPKMAVPALLNAIKG